MPSAHWLSRLNVAGATTMASGTRDRGVPGARCWLRTGDPVSPSTSAASKNARADGVAITWTVQPRSTACLTSDPTSAAGAAPDTTIESTPFFRAMKTSIERRGGIGAGEHRRRAEPLGAVDARAHNGDMRVPRPDGSVRQALTRV